MKLGLTKLRRASLSREGERERRKERKREKERERERERERESKRAEAGHEPRSSGLRLPKYWDYKRPPPRPATVMF